MYDFLKKFLGQSPEYFLEAQNESMNTFLGETLEEYLEISLELFMCQFPWSYPEVMSCRIPERVHSGIHDEISVRIPEAIPGETSDEISGQI